jgi:hypothetical protein
MSIRAARFTASRSLKGETMNGQLDLQALQRICGELVVARIMAESYAAAVTAENEKLKQEITKRPEPKVE